MVLESIGVAALGWVVSPLVAKLLNRGYAILGMDPEKKLKKLTDTVLPVLKSVIEKAEGSPHRSKVEGWLQRLKDAYDDAEDALDLLNYDRLERKEPADSSNPVPKNVLKKIKLERSLNELEKIAGEAEELRNLLLNAESDPTAAAPDSSQTFSLPPPKVFGRYKDREEIIRHLKTKPAAGVPVPIIAIVGRPGVGKTTLAQYVCKQLRSELGYRRHFDPIMWVYASRNFKAPKIMKDIIQQASIASKHQDHCNLTSLEAHQLKINEKLKAKKFLLVIDNVWCDGEDHENNWDTLYRCLSECCLLGSKILITSQTKDAPKKIGAAIRATVECIYPLKDIGKKYFSDLFIYYALPSGQIKSPSRKELEEKCRTIAEKLSEDPTAAKMIGKAISMEMPCPQGNLHAYLDEIAQKDWSGDKTKVLMWSYRHLPAHLQHCFSYCSLYPRGHKFKALELVQLWMAQGFIEPGDQNKRMEDVCNNYLNELVSRFYIQQSRNGYYTLHKLLYNLATKVSSSFCLRMEGKKGKIPSTIRHLCIPADKLNENKEEICKLERLRTLIVTKGESVTSKEKVATDISSSLKEFHLKKLRVLVLEFNPKNLAEFTNGMKHLRILQVSRELESVCTLYQLQVLQIKSASSLPKCLNNLVSLRYLEVNSDLIFVIPDIGKLTSLQRLENFHARKEKGYELEQLKNLNELRGSLRIDNFENVESTESASAANLKEKKHLDTLEFRWCDRGNNVNSNMDAEILAGLQLPPNLTTLHLDGYRGRLWPSWRKNQTGNITKLALRKCGMLEKLPPMDQLYPYCRSLELSHLSRLKALHTLPPRLRKIAIFCAPFLTFVTKEDLQMSPVDKRFTIKVMRKRMPKWFPHQYQESLVRDEREMGNFIAATNGSNSNEASSREHDKRAPAATDADITAVRERWLEMHERKMELIYSRRNETKLLLPSTLTVLWLEGCNITNRALSACLQTLTSLTCLSLVDIRTITCLPFAYAVAKLKGLKTLRLKNCWALTSLGGIRSLPRLEDLILIGCPCLDGKTASLPSSLQSIHSEFCANVDVILTDADLRHLSSLTITQCRMRTAQLKFGNLESLHTLIIKHCPELSSLANVQKLRSLKSLTLENCLKLQEVSDLPKSLELRIHECPILKNP